MKPLYLRNSIEDLINCAWSGLPALLLLRVLDVLKAWRLTGRDTRDNWRICAIETLFSWTHWRWRAKIRYFAERCISRELEAALKTRAEPAIILIAGFKAIAAPLLARYRQALSAPPRE
jgi:hypothetical protein